MQTSLLSTSPLFNFMSTSDERLTDLEQQVLALWRAIKGEQSATPESITEAAYVPAPEVKREAAYAVRPVISEESLERYRTAAAQIAHEIESRVYD